MKVCFVSDLHVDFPKNRAIVQYLVEEVAHIAPDIFLLLGDISPDIAELQETLFLFAHLDCQKLFVPGNHDIWILSKRQRQKKGLDSYCKYNILIAEACQYSGFHHLGLKPFLLNNIGFIGAIGWYDYSLRNDSLDAEIPFDAYRAKRLGLLVYNDREYAYWGKCSDSQDWRIRILCLRVPDEVIVQQQLDFLRVSIAEVKERGAQTIVCATHCLPFRELVEYTGRVEEDFFCAFLGSLRIGELIMGESLIKYVLFGHDHNKRNFLGEIGGKQVASCSVGYLEHFKGDLRQYAAKCLGCLNLF